jgi:hypothetical protein
VKKTVARPRKTAAKRSRLKLGPDTIERTVVDKSWREPERDLKRKTGPDVDRAKESTALWEQARASGELYVDLPAKVLHMPDGETITIPGHFGHPLMTRLSRLAVDFIAQAKEHVNDEAAAVGHLLSAIALAIRENDLGVLNEGDGNPHAWARRYLASRSGDGIPIRSGVSMPFLQDNKGRRLNVAQLSGGFVIVEELIAMMFGTDHRIDDLDMVADCMRDNLPSLVSLRDDVTAVRARVCAELERLASKHERDLRSRRADVRRRAIESVTEALIEAECLRSKVNPVHALAFLRKR